MTVRDDIYLMVFEWLRQTSTLDYTPLAEGQVIRLEQPVAYGNIRPPTPYLTVKVRVADTLVGTDEMVETETVDPDELERHVRGLRTGMIEVMGYGKEASDWMALAHLRLSNIDVITDILNDPAGPGGITLIPEGGGERDLSVILGDRYEARYMREYTVHYQLNSAAGKQTAPATSTIEVDMTFGSDSPPGDFSRTITAPEP